MAMSTHFLYFAYGSNLLSARLKARTPSARARGMALLEGHALRWHMSSLDGSGKCDVVANEASHVQGVVYEIALHEKPHLDAAESLGSGYCERQLSVRMGAETHPVWLYCALRTDPLAQPYDWYKGLVMAGAREHGLGADYIRDLEAVQAKADADAARAALHFKLAGF